MKWILTCCAVPEIRHPEVLVVGVNERHQRRASVHAQECFSITLATFVLIVDNSPNCGVVIMFETFDPTKDIKHIMSDGIVERDY